MPKFKASVFILCQNIEPCVRNHVLGLLHNIRAKSHTFILQLEVLRVLADLMFFVARYTKEVVCSLWRWPKILYIVLYHIICHCSNFYNDAAYE